MNYEHMQMKEASHKRLYIKRFHLHKYPEKGHKVDYWLPEAKGGHKDSIIR